MDLKKIILFLISFSIMPVLFVINTVGAMIFGMISIVINSIYDFFDNIVTDVEGDTNLGELVGTSIALVVISGPLIYLSDNVEKYELIVFLLAVLSTVFAIGWVTYTVVYIISKNISVVMEKLVDALDVIHKAIHLRSPFEIYDGISINKYCERKAYEKYCRKMEEERRRAEENRRQEEKRWEEYWRQEERRRAEEYRKQEERRRAEEYRRQEERRRAEEYRKQEERRRAEEYRRQEERKRAEEYRRQEEENKRKKNEEERKKKQNQVMTIKKALEIFGLQENADMTAIRKKYRKLISMYHPDQPNGDTKKTQEINQAYDYLKKHYVAA